MSVRTALSIQARVILLALGALSCGQTDTGPVEHVVTQATLDALPRIDVTEGRQLCRALGSGSCPLGTAVANWLDDTRFAVWEPGRAVQVWDATDSLPLELGAKEGDNQAPIFAIAVAARGREFLVFEGRAGRLLRFDKAGKLLETVSVPRPAGFAVKGFLLGEAVMQTMQPAGPGGGTKFELLHLRDPLDTLGPVLFSVTLPWLPLDEGRSPPIPLFPAWPSFALDGDGGLAWTPGDRFVLYRLDRKARAIWTLKSDLTGAPITAEDIAGRRQELAGPTGAAALTDVHLDSMVALTAKTHPAIAGLAMNRAQEILLAGPVTPGSDSVDFYRVTSDGTLKDRFMLSKRTRVLLFSGDSILVHRPTRGEPWEIRWLRLKPTR